MVECDQSDYDRIDYSNKMDRVLPISINLPTFLDVSQRFVPLPIHARSWKRGTLPPQFRHRESVHRLQRSKVSERGVVRKTIKPREEQVTRNGPEEERRREQRGLIAGTILPG